jgi:hypothetical protein
MEKHTMYIVKASETSLTPHVISGRSLVHRKLNARQRAAIAADILAGKVVIELSTCQLAQLIGVSVPYIRAARQPSQRQALPKPISDIQLTSIIRNAGLDRTLAAACAVENVA